MRPAGFEPANSPNLTTALSEECDGRIISPLRFQTTLRARLWRRSFVRRGRVVVRLRLLGRPRIAPPGFEPGTPGSRPSGIAAFPTGLLVAPPRFERGPPRSGRGALAACATGLMAAKTGTRPPNDGGAQTSDVKTPTASRTRFSELWRRYLLAASLTAVGRQVGQVVEGGDVRRSCRVPSGPHERWLSCPRCAPVRLRVRRQNLPARSWWRLGETVVRFVWRGDFHR